MSGKEEKADYPAIIRCDPHALVHGAGIPLPIIRAVRREASVALFGDGFGNSHGEAKSQESGMSVVDMLSVRSDEGSMTGTGLSSIFLTLASSTDTFKTKEDSVALRNASVLDVLTKRNDSDTFESEVAHSFLYELGLMKNDKIDRHLGYLEVLRLHAMNEPRKAKSHMGKLEHRGGLIVDLQRKPFATKRIRTQKSALNVDNNESSNSQLDVIDLSFSCAKAGLKVLLIDSCNDIGVQNAFFRDKMKDKMKTLAAETRDMDTHNEDDHFTKQLYESTLDRIHLQTVHDVWELMNVCKSISVQKEDCFDVIFMSDFRKLIYAIDVPSGDTKSVQMLRTILASIQSSMFNLTNNNSLLFVINESFELERNVCNRCAKKPDKQLFCEYCSQYNVFNRLLHFLYRKTFDCVVNMC